MEDNAEFDFYLLNRLGQLKVSRGSNQVSSNAQREPSVLLATRIDENGHLSFVLPNWRDSNGQMLKPGVRPPLIQAIIDSIKK